MRWLSWGSREVETPTVEGVEEEDPTPKPKRDCRGDVRILFFAMDFSG